MATAPALPAALNTGDVVGNTHVDAYRAGLELHRDTKPHFKAQATSLGASGGGTVDTATATEAEISDGAGAFNFTAEWNIGSWTAGSAGDHGLIVPLDGLIEVMVYCEWQADTSGYRQISIKVNAANFDDNRSRVAPSPSGVTRQHAPVTFDANTSDSITIELLQNSGSTLNAEVYITAKWLVHT